MSLDLVERELTEVGIFEDRRTVPLNTREKKIDYYDVVLIHPYELQRNDFSSREFSVPISIWYLGSYLKAHGLRVKLIDCESNPNHMEEIKELVPKTSLVGLTMMTAQISHGMEIAKMVKGVNPNLSTVIGGIHPTLYYEDVVNNQYIDFAVYGEGEIVLMELVASLRLSEPDFFEIGALSYKKDGKVFYNEEKKAVDHGAYPDLDYDLLLDCLNKSNWNKNDIAKYSYPIITSRGCPYKCTFCASAIIDERTKVRSWPMEKIMREVQRALELGFRDIFFWDDNILLGRAKIKTFLNEIKKLGTKFTWYGNARADFFNERYLSKEILTELRENGLNRMSIGAESGSQKMLDYMKKELKVENYIKAAEYCAHAGIEPSFSFMIGMPYEEIEDINATMDLIRKIGDILPIPKIIGPSMFLPLPGNEMYDDCVASGWVPPSNLEEWADINSGYGSDAYERSWVKDPDVVLIIWFYSWLIGIETKKIIKILNKYSNLVGYSRLKTLVVVSAGVVGSICGKLRYKFNFYRFPIEVKLFSNFREIGAL